MSTPDWKDVLPAPRAGARLQEAWMTSFDRADAGLLVEHLLPSLLGASRALAQEPRERTLFFGELGTTLETLHGRLTVITSPLGETQEPSQYPWLWRYVSHFTVGMKSPAVQHAKLWAFHWNVAGEEVLELHVSSTNLTAAAFKAQVQAGWTVSLLLGQRSGMATRGTWGEFVQFLDALGASAGDIAATRIARLVTLLGRVECPPDVAFVASIPGQKSAGSQIRQFDPVELHVLTPTIGNWTDKSLSDWSVDVGVAASKVHLKWIANDHPWAASGGWSLSPAASSTLKGNGVRLACLPIDARFTAQHLDGDSRWSHAKLYLIRSKNKKKRKLLITSANWSSSAWGAGKLKVRNFELGVVIGTDWTDLEAIKQPFGEGKAPFCCEEECRIPDELKLQWAEACWDGKCIRLHARSVDSSTPIVATVTFIDALEKRRALAGGAGVVRWNDSTRVPLIAQFSQGAETLEVGILDLRPPAEFVKTPLPEVDPALATALREAFLLQRYGGPAVDVDGISGLGRRRGRAGGAAPPADYSVQAWLDARAAFGVVDKWLVALEEAKSQPGLLERVRLDGEQLLAFYERQGGPAANLVSEELGWRMDKEA